MFNLWGIAAHRNQQLHKLFWCSEQPVLLLRYQAADASSLSNGTGLHACGTSDERAILR